MKYKVFSIYAYNGDCCLMLVNSTDCSHAVRTACAHTDVENVIEAEFLQAEELYGLEYHIAEQCVITVFDSEITEND